MPVQWQPYPGRMEYCVNVCVGVILSYIYINSRGVALPYRLPALCSTCSTEHPPSHHTSNSWSHRWTATPGHLPHTEPSVKLHCRPPVRRHCSHWGPTSLPPSWLTDWLLSPGGTKSSTSVPAGGTGTSPAAQLHTSRNFSDFSCRQFLVFAFGFWQ